MRFRSWFVGLAAGWSLACSNGTGPDPQANVLDLSSPRTRLVPSETVQLSWEIRDSKGAPVAGQTPTFSSSSQSVATVSTSGLVTAVGPGSATISAQVGSARDQVALSVVDGGVVSSAGGTLLGAGGALELVVPPGAVPSATAVELTTTPNPLLDPTAVAGPVFSIGPSTLTFATPATVRIRFDLAAAPVGLLAAEVRLRRFDGTAWTPAADPTTDATARIASGTTTEGGLFSAGWTAPSQPCTSPESRQFDFWLGAWSVSSNGQTFAQSDITLVPGGCAVLEHFRPNGAPVGRSISFYQPATGMWYQTYLDSGGARLVIAGSFVGGVMDLFNPPSKGTVHQRWRWTVEGANVRQVSTETANGGVSYGAPSFNGLYTKR